MLRIRSALMMGSLLVAASFLPACHTERPPAVLSPQGATTPEETPGGLYGDSTTPIESDEFDALSPDGVMSESFADAVLTEQAGPLSDVYFGFDQYDLTDEARATLERHAAWLQTRRNTRVLIEGHCDERGTVEYNLALGDRRAQVVRDYLISLGVAAGRLTAVSLGKERPVDFGHDEGAWARNRRAHFVVSR